MREGVVTRKVPCGVHDAGFWSLVDEQGDGLLPQQNMEDAVYACLEPPLLTVSMTYPTLPILQKQHKKPFIKFVKVSVR